MPVALTSTITALSFITCALVSLRTSAPQDVAAVIAECHAEILMGYKVMAFGSQLLQRRKRRGNEIG